MFESQVDVVLDPFAKDHGIQDPNNGTQRVFVTFHEMSSAVV